MRAILLCLLFIFFSCNNKKEEVIIESEPKKVEETQKPKHPKEEVKKEEPKKITEPKKKEVKKEPKKKGNTPKPVVKKTFSTLEKYLIGDVRFSRDANFEKVPSKYATKEMYLRKETLKAFIEMAESAKKDGVKLIIISGARSFKHQKSIWERKWNKSTIKNPTEKARNILLYSSMPMTSRHHWGTDIDINNLNNKYFTHGKGLKEYNWLIKNASKFGFCQVYTDKSKGRTGYQMEKWHWSYLPLANELLDQYSEHVNLEDISGFKGSETATELNVIHDYVNGINSCF